MTAKNDNNRLKWDNYYSIGHEKIDAQNCELFDKVNSLIDSCKDGSDVSKLNETLVFIVNYAVQHFYDEEALQRECNYPDYERHKKLHEEFKNSAVDLLLRYSSSGSSLELYNETKKIIIKWLIRHIMEEDKKIGIYLKKINHKVLLITTLEKNKKRAA